MNPCKYCGKDSLPSRWVCKEHHLAVRREQERDSNARRNRKRTKEYIRAQNVKTRYGITIDRVNELLVEQGGGCAICGRMDSGTRDWCVDHDHACCEAIPNMHACGNCVRGIVCYNCNNMLGYAIDNPDNLMAGVTYLMSKVDVLSMAVA